jgi:ring-1,2-phenylacetyl-CoA epoxidase subunit PaaE
MKKISITLDGITTTEQISDSQTILERAKELELDPPYSCEGGICTSCKAKIINGTVEMKLNHALTPKEIAKGYILTCQSHVTSDSLTISYDE